MFDRQNVREKQGKHRHERQGHYRVDAQACDGQAGVSFVTVIALLLAPVTDPEILRKLNEQSTQPPKGYVLDPPPCPEGETDCNWWERYPRVESNPFENYAPKLPPGPAYLVIANPQTIRTIPYKTMAACERARRYAAGPPAGTRLPNGAVLGFPLVTYNCVPR